MMSGANSAARMSWRLAWMVSVWRDPSSVPTGVLALAAFNAFATSSIVRLRAASASGRTRTRTAKRFWPFTLICASIAAVAACGSLSFRPAITRF